MCSLRLWLAIIALVKTQALYAAPETLIIAGDLWCPVNCAVGANRPGIFIELAQRIFAEHGIKVEYKLTNWARAIHDTRLGRINAVVGAGVRDAPDFIFTKTAPGVSRICFYAKPDQGWRYEGLGSLEKITVGTINGYSYGAELNAYFERNKSDQTRVQQASGDRALAINIDKLRKNRVDAVIENSWVMQAYLAAEGKANELIDVGCRKIDVPIYVAFSPALKSSQAYADIFQQGLERLKANGELDALYRRYAVDQPGTGGNAPQP
ncbi:substrate-binding periplasmic protein [Pseudomonas sp. NPDC078700]|uniref:substrate-binding periplasmic protein n=1 Tax=Pseudomonas sp. NPDC078700 TaxID=3364424 RepID=UPI0037C9D9F8